MDRVYGVVIGLVIDVADPDEHGRVKLSFPWLAEDAQSGWAPIARPMAGNDRGYYYMPEIDDEALVAFEHGDVNHPMVLGFLHNGVDRPPYKDVDVHVRRLKTVAGHVLEFDDRSGQEAVRLHSNNHHQLELSDTGGYVELLTANGQKIRMQDQPGQIKLSTVSGTTVTLDDLPSQISLTTAGGVSVTISDTGGVSVTSATGGVTVNALSAQVTSMSSASVSAPQVSIDAAILNVNSGMATFSGVVQCQTLISTSVVSASYTPGAGNIW
jgi:uncharacterized protein involved in type VI secretion and phage assembly